MYTRVQYEPSVPRSKDLALTWEAFAEKMEHAFDGSVIVAKVREKFELLRSTYDML